MNLIQLIACIGLITGCFVLLHISPMDFTEGVFRRITSKPKSIRSEVNESTRRKKKSFLRREIEETQTILRMTGRAAKFPMVCALSLLLFLVGAAFALTLGNLFLVPVLAVGMMFVPFWFIRLTANHYKKNIAAELETALSIVLLETMKAADKDHRVFKLQFEAGEFDMVIYDQKENSCEIFEIKHSSKQVPFQYRHLVDEDKCQRTERRFGPIHGRYILYRGEDAQMENGVQYWNVENYLKALPTLDIVQVQEIGMQSIEPTL